MKLVIDCNIIISAIISPDGTIANVIFNKLKGTDLLAPNYLFHEILNKQDKILRITGYSSDEFFDLLYLLTKRIDFIDESLISEKFIKKAYDLTINVDTKDTYYVALSLQSKADIWTGDKKLLKGLRQNGFNNILDTKELLKNIL